MHHPRLFERILERRHTLAAKGVVLCQGGDAHTWLVLRGGVGNGILGAVAGSAENIAVPFCAGDGVRHRRFNDEDFFVFFGHRQHGQ